MAKTKKRYVVGIKNTTETRRLIDVNCGLAGRNAGLESVITEQQATIEKLKGLFSKIEEVRLAGNGHCFLCGSHSADHFSTCELKVALTDISSLTSERDNLKYQCDQQAEIEKMKTALVDIRDDKYPSPKEVAFIALTAQKPVEKLMDDIKKSHPNPKIRRKNEHKRYSQNSTREGRI